MILNPWKALRVERDENLAARVEMWRQICQLEREISSAQMECVKLEDALKLVIDQEKPTSNSTVKRMANIARQGLLP